MMPTKKQDERTSALIVPSCDGQSREHFWEPYTWKRTGVGMSKPITEDLSDYYEIKGKKIIALKVYGLGKNDSYAPLRACIEFKHAAIIFDRAAHNVGEMRVFDSKGDEKAKISRWDYTRIWEEGKTPEFFGSEKFPYGEGISQFEHSLDYVVGKTVSEFSVSGNYTLAVGFLPIGGSLFLEEGLYLKIGASTISKEEISKTLGKKCSNELDGLHILIVHAGKYKKD